MPENRETLLNRAIAAIERPTDYNEHDRRQLLMELRAACDTTKRDTFIDQPDTARKF
jgi:hypothetical protein